MVYKLNVTEHADELLDKLVYHLIYRLKNDQAAKHLLDCIDVIYDRLEVNPFQFAECRDAYLSKKGFLPCRICMAGKLCYTKVYLKTKAIPHNSKCRYGERGAAAAGAVLKP